MQKHIQILTQQLFSKSNLAEVTAEEIQSVIDQYPYMGIGHWLKAKQSSENTDDALNASIYSYNPTWLYFSLTAGFDDTVVLKSEPKVVAAEVNEIKELKEPKPVESTKVETKAIETTEAVESSSTTTTEVSKTNFKDQLSKLKIDLPKSDDSGLTFEPYHTIDYFASLGIKLQSEDYKDKLGKQLKSFTEWLREMKRIQPAEQAVELEKRNPVTQIDSNRSIDPPEILTETMAEVWVKQGNKLKAIAIYEKLSLLYPNKKPYFANKIELLKDA